MNYVSAKQVLYRTLKLCVKDNKITKLERKSISKQLSKYNSEFLNGIVKEVVNSGHHLKQILESNFQGTNNYGYPLSLTHSYIVKDAPIGLSLTISSVNDFGQGRGQGSVGTCAVLAASMDNLQYINNGDETFTFKFYRDTTPDYVTVNSYIDSAISSTGVLGLVEKAYAKWRAESGALAFKAGRRISSWEDITGGNTLQTPLGAMTGRSCFIEEPSSSYTPRINLEELALAISFGKTVLLGNAQKSQSSKMVQSNHAYKVVGASSNGLELKNPWGFNRVGGVNQNDAGLISLSASQINSSFPSPYFVIS